MPRLHPIPGLAVLASAGAIAAVPAPPARAATQVSTNWAGYAITPRGGPRFRKVSGSWRVPRIDCSSTSPGFSAAWIGLGGFTDSSRALEQTGTDVDCSGSGRATYSAWYELVPAASRTIAIAVHPGDRMAAVVAVRGRRVTLTLNNRTTGRRFRRTVAMASPDVSSAEWMVEAPAGCDNSGRCQQLPLGDFGSVTFSGARATDTKGHGGFISNRSWSATAVSLSQNTQFTAGTSGASPGAVPSALVPGGSGFSVTYRARAGSLGKAAEALPALARRRGPELGG